MFVANDGFSAGHVVRTLAIATALGHRARACGVEVTMLLATTSEADALWAGSRLAIVRLPAPLAGRRAGLSDMERRRIVRGCIEAAASSFAPDVLVVDTFPAGPHGELAFDARAKRVLVRRHVPEARANDDTLTTRLASYDLVVLADDPTAVEGSSAIRCVHVPPITALEADDMASRDDARAHLGLPGDARVVLVTSGGGGDHEAAARASRIADAVAMADPSVVVAVTRGPLAQGDRCSGSPRVVPLSVAPLAPWLAAFDGAFAAAGYNTAHELAKAGVPAALFACPRPFDDQLARAERFAGAGLARVLVDDQRETVAGALAWMASAPRPSLVGGGAERAAEAILALATGRRA